MFRLGRLYDQQRGALSLASLVETIRANQHLFDEASFRERLKDNPFVDGLAKDARRPDSATLDSDARSVVESDTLVERLVAIRNRVLAHRDPRVVLGASDDPAAALAAVDVDTLLARAATVVNRYGILFRAGSHLMRIVGHDDFRSVLRHVRSVLVATEREINEEIARANVAKDAG
jgi:hypothetical protein